MLGVLFRNVSWYIHLSAPVRSPRSNVRSFTLLLSQRAWTRYAEAIYNTRNNLRMSGNSLNNLPKWFNISIAFILVGKAQVTIMIAKTLK